MKRSFMTGIMMVLFLGSISLFCRATDTVMVAGDGSPQNYKIDQKTLQSLDLKNANSATVRDFKEFVIRTTNVKQISKVVSDSYIKQPLYFNSSNNELLVNASLANSDPQIQAALAVIKSKAAITSRIHLDNPKNSTNDTALQMRAAMNTMLTPDQKAALIANKKATADEFANSQPPLTEEQKAAVIAQAKTARADYKDDVRKPQIPWVNLIFGILLLIVGILALRGGQRTDASVIAMLMGSLSLWAGWSNYNSEIDRRSAKDKQLTDDWLTEYNEFFPDPKTSKKG